MWSICWNCVDLKWMNAGWVMPYLSHTLQGQTDSIRLPWVWRIDQRYFLWSAKPADPYPWLSWKWGHHDAFWHADLVWIGSIPFSQRCGGMGLWRRRCWFAQKWMILQDHHDFNWENGYDIAEVKNGPGNHCQKPNNWLNHFKNQVGSFYNRMPCLLFVAFFSKTFTQSKSWSHSSGYAV